MVSSASLVRGSFTSEHWGRTGLSAVGEEEHTKRENRPRAAPSATSDDRRRSRDGSFRTRRVLVPDVDNLEALVRDALFTTRATAVCPFHPEVIIRVGDAAAETHAYYRARNVIKRDGTS